MSLVKHILFPVDFSERCVAIAPAVAAYAKHFASRVSLLYAFDSPAEWGDELEAGLDPALFTAVETRLKSRLDGFLRDMLPDAERVVMHGKAARAIVAAAKEHGSDLIMMPTRGHSRFHQMLLGSTVTGVLQDAECAVWTSAHADVVRIPATCRSIVCALDMSDASVAVIQAAQLMASAWKAKLAVVHEVESIDPHFESAVADRAHEFLIASAKERYQEIARKAGFAPELEIVEEPRLGQGLAEAAVRHEADLLVIGRGAIHGVLGRLRSHVHEILRLSPCPVLSV